MYPFSGISYEKIIPKIYPGNGMECDASDVKKFHELGLEYKPSHTWAMCRKLGSGCGRWRSRSTSYHREGGFSLTCLLRRRSCRKGGDKVGPVIVLNAVTFYNLVNKFVNSSCMVTFQPDFAVKFQSVRTKHIFTPRE